MEFPSLFAPVAQLASPLSVLLVSPFYRLTALLNTGITPPKWHVPLTSMGIRPPTRFLHPGDKKEPYSASGRLRHPALENDKTLGQGDWLMVWQKLKTGRSVCEARRVVTQLVAPLGSKASEHDSSKGSLVPVQ